jgi:hypothetical protein
MLKIGIFTLKLPGFETAGWYYSWIFHTYGMATKFSRLKMKYQLSALKMESTVMCNESTELNKSFCTQTYTCST